MLLNQSGRYIISGGTAALLTLSTLFILHEVLDVYYLVASVIAYVAGMSVSFFLQKMWTFQDGDMKKVGFQGFLYITLFLINLISNALLMYLFVDLFHIYYMASQIFAAGMIAVYSFFVYKHVVFTRVAYEKNKRA